MNKRIFGTAIMMFGAMILAVGGCAITPLCGNGEVACGNGCMPAAGTTCCSSAGDYCSNGYLCGPGNTCISSTPAPVSGCEYCLSIGEQCCANSTPPLVDCAPVNCTCGGNHTHTCP